MVITGIIFGFVTSVSITELCACSLSTNDEEPKKSRLSLFRLNKNTRTTVIDDIQNFASNLSTNVLLTVYIFLSTGINVSIKCIKCFPCCQSSPSWYLLVLSPHWKHQNNVWNLFKVINRDTGTTSRSLFWCFYC